MVKYCLWLALAAILACSNLNAQIDFDRPDVIPTSFTRQMSDSIYPIDGPVHANPPMADSGAMYSHSAADCPSCNNGYAESIWGGGCDSCGDSYGFIDECCCPTQSRFGLTVSGIVDIPLDGVFHTGDDARVTAGALGIAPAILPPAAPIDLIINEQGFEDIYNTFGGVEANINMLINCNTSLFFGYRFVQGQADLVTVGQAIEYPDTTPVAYDITAQFSEYRESQLQAGFLTSQCIRGSLDFLWGGRMGVGFVDEITGTLNVPGVVTLADVPFYDDTTNFTFGFNMGLRKTFGCHFSVQALTGAEYRTSLNQDDTVLGTLGLDELNNGSGFATLPIYIGMTYRR